MDDEAISIFLPFVQIPRSPRSLHSIAKTVLGLEVLASFLLAEGCDEVNLIIDSYWHEFEVEPSHSEQHY